MIEFRHVSASYALETPVLKDISFTIDQGEFVAFVGTNGAGKSTTMRLVNGLLKPTSGEVLIDGVPTTELKVSELARRVGFLFQNPDRQICCNTVREEMQFGLKAQGLLNDESVARAEALMAEFGLDPDAEPFLLNRGSRQLLALLSIIVPQPPVLVLDEPTTGLDYLECERVMETVRRLHEDGTTIIMVCHDMEVVGDFAKRVIAVNAGRIVADGPTFTVLRDERVLREADLRPPQIVDISMQLARDLPERVPADCAIARANTLSELTQALEDDIYLRTVGEGRGYPAAGGNAAGYPADPSSACGAAGVSADGEGGRA